MKAIVKKVTDTLAEVPKASIDKREKKMRRRWKAERYYDTPNSAPRSAARRERWLRPVVFSRRWERRRYHSAVAYKAPAEKMAKRAAALDRSGIT